MKRTQFKDAVRNIRGQIVSFISIVLVVTLGTSAFLAFQFGMDSLYGKANQYYSDMQYRDIEIQSTRGITEDDLEAVRQISGVADVEGFTAVDMIAENSGGERTTVHIASKTERIDHVALKSGGLPQRSGECAIAQQLAESLGLKEGDRITVTPRKASGDFLTASELTVKGIFLHPNHFQHGESDRFEVLVMQEDLDLSKLEAPYLGMLIRTDTENMDTFSEEYEERVKKIEREISLLGKERASVRDAELIASARARIADGEKKLVEAKAQLDAGKSEAEEKAATISDADVQLKIAVAKLELAKAQLSSSETEITDGKKQLEDAKKALDDAKKQLDSARKQLDDAKAQLDDGAAELEIHEAELREGRIQLDENRQKLTDAEVELRAGRAALDTTESAIETMTGMVNAVIKDVWDPAFGAAPALRSVRDSSENYTRTYEELTHHLLVDQNGLSEEQYQDFIAAAEASDTWIQFRTEYQRLYDSEKQYQEGYAQYQDGLSRFTAAQAEYDEGNAQYAAGKAEYDRSLALYQEKETEYKVGKASYEANLRAYEDGVKKYNAGLEKYEDSEGQINSGTEELEEGKQELQEGSEKLEEGTKTLAEKQAEYEAGVKELEDARAQLAAYQPGSWILTDRVMNRSFNSLNSAAKTFVNMRQTFSTIFILLSMLVCYATIGKIVDEQRVLIGATKALGFTRGEIMAKYLIFGGFGAFLGGLGGIALAYFLLEGLMLSSTAQALMLGSFPRSFLLLPSALCVVFATALGIFSAWIACNRLIERPATDLLRGEMPQVHRNKIRSGKKKTRSLYTGLILRNIRSDLKRVGVTVISIAGSCMLLMIGFAMKLSYVKLIDRQFTQITDYDACVQLRPDAAETEIEEVIEKLRDADTDYTKVYQLDTLTRIGNNLEGAQVFCVDPDALPDYMHLYDIRRESEHRIPDGGVYIYNRLAETYSLTVGDHISILDSAGVYHDVPISGIYQSYAGRSIYLSESFGREIFGREYQYNTVLARTSRADVPALRSELRKCSAFLCYTASDEARARHQIVSNMMNKMVYVMIGTAGLMAAVVLLNLVMIQLNQKKRELTVMRVNGFTIGETVGYILKENILTTAAGILLGLLSGQVASQIILSSLERVELQMIRGPIPEAYLFSGLITLFFALVVNLIALSRIRQLNFRDAQ
ncbi:MAG: FtsX-like permease family protein [Oscillospiraceae bacterium]|nr:FtsX-like permease family protein [Oscillospiraceae bacterium]